MTNRGALLLPPTMLLVKKCKKVCIEIVLATNSSVWGNYPARNEYRNQSSDPLKICKIKLAHCFGTVCCSNTFEIPLWRLAEDTESALKTLI